MNVNSSPVLINWSGTRLFVILAMGLGIVAIALDESSGRLSAVGFSLSLPFWISTLLVALVGYWTVPFLTSIKAGQVIREDGPQSHLKKSGTPTMGGVFFIPVGVLVGLIAAGFKPEVTAVALLTLAYGAIGWLDDWQILRRKSNKGISPRMKLILQTGCGVLFSLWMMFTQPASLSNLHLPGEIILPLGIFFWGLAALGLVSASNAVNLTDGLDGLAGGTSAIAFLGLAILLAPSHPEFMVFCGAMSGSCLGFLIYNRNPAQVFMGDTGSMALGGALIGVALITGQIWAGILLSGLFIVETLSVIAQVSYYKATKGPDGIGKRLLKMAPLHHHLELSGWSETQVVGVFYGVVAILALITVLTA